MAKSKKWAVYIIGMKDDEDRTEYVADVFKGYNSREEAINAKRHIIGFDGVWSGCDVYARVAEEEGEE